MHPTVLDTFYVIDLDRTLFDTDVYTTIFLGYVQQYNAQVATELAAVASRLYVRGLPFSLYEHVAAQLGQQATAAIQYQLVTQHAPAEFLLPNAHALLRATAERHGIVTYGDVSGQQYKLEAAGLTDTPTLITPVREKGKLMTSWKWVDGEYVLPEQFGGYVVKDIVLIDDRLISFKGISDAVRGYWLTTDVPTLGEVSTIPAQVSVVHSLQEVFDLEQLDKT